jgi:hypothetical protein
MIMSIEHRVDPEMGILFVKRSGRIRTRDEELAFKQRQEDPLVVPGISVLVDCREVSPADSTKVIRYLAGQVTNLAVQLQCGPVAIIVSSDVEYGMARMYMALTELAYPNTMVFRDYEEGLAWLLAQAERK